MYMTALQVVSPYYLYFCAIDYKFAIVQLHINKVCSYNDLLTETIN